MGKEEKGTFPARSVNNHLLWLKLCFYGGSFSWMRTASKYQKEAIISPTVTSIQCRSYDKLFKVFPIIESS